MDIYKTTYEDAHGSQTTTISNDGKVLHMRLRDIEFSGQDFDQFCPPEETPARQLDSFVLNGTDLCACRLRWSMSVAVMTDNREASGELHFQLDLGTPSANGGIDKQELKLEVTIADQRYNIPGPAGFFEEILLDLSSLLPAKTHLKCCFTCLYSDYSPFGNGLFGDMLCFRRCKSDYLKVKEKTDLLKLLDDHNSFVQETWLCGEYARRIARTGYRG